MAGSALLRSAIKGSRLGVLVGCGVLVVVILFISEGKLASMVGDVVKGCGLQPANNANMIKKMVLFCTR